MFNVIKRDGEVAAFQLSKITQAIEKAFQAQEKQYTPDMMEMLGLRVTADFQKKIKKDQVSVEDIQDSVENVLIQCGYSEVAKAYILYRKQREKVRNMKSTILDYKEIVNSYVKVEDWRVKENSTVTYSVGGLILSNSGAVTANYWLSEIYDKEIADAHRNADIHIHDLSRIIHNKTIIRHCAFLKQGAICTAKIIAPVKIHLITVHFKRMDARFCYQSAIFIKIIISVQSNPVYCQIVNIPYLRCC